MDKKEIKLAGKITTEEAKHSTIIHYSSAGIEIYRVAEEDINAQ